MVLRIHVYVLLHRIALKTQQINIGNTERTLTEDSFSGKETFFFCFNLKNVNKFGCTMNELSVTITGNLLSDE